MKKEVFDKIVKKSTQKKPPIISCWTEETNNKTRFWGLSYEENTLNREKVDDLNFFLKQNNGRPLEGCLVIQSDEINSKCFNQALCTIGVLLKEQPQFNLPKFNDLIIINSKGDYYSMSENHMNTNSDVLNGIYFNNDDFLDTLRTNMLHVDDERYKRDFEFKQGEKLEPEKNNKKIKM